MDNPELGRMILKHVDAFPESFDMATFFNPCGTTACLAGHALLLDGGYELKGLRSDSRPGFYRPDGSYVEDIELEALNLLGMAEEEYFDDNKPPVFYTGDADDAIARFTEAVESGLPGCRWVDVDFLYHCMPAGGQ